MKRNKQWYKGPERRQLRRQRILLGVTAAGFTIFAVIHFALYNFGK